MVRRGVPILSVNTVDVTQVLDVDTILVTV